MKIAEIDLGLYFTSADKSRDQLKNDINHSLKTSGCLLIKDDDIDLGLIEEMQKATLSFFNLPLENKLQNSRPSNGAPRGYNALETESLAQTKGLKIAKDLNESFQIGPLNSPVFHGNDNSHHQYANNIWPDFSDDFKPTWIKYYQAMEKLSTKLLKLFSECLDIPEGELAQLCTHHTARLRARNYPQLTKAADATQFRASAHTDYGAFSILLPCPGVNGLQFFSEEENQWVDVDSKEKHFVVNIGDLMMIITNNYWKAPLHQVVAPNLTSEYNKNRLSIIFFYSFNYDALICPNKRFVSLVNPSQYEPVLTVDYIMRKLNTARNHY